MSKQYDAATLTYDDPLYEYDGNGPPDAPTSLVAESIAEDQVQLTWVAPVETNGAAIDGYKIERESPTGAGFTTIVEDTGNTDLIYVDMTVSPDTQYNYRVRARNTYGAGDPSNESGSAQSLDDIFKPPLRFPMNQS